MRGTKSPLLLSNRSQKSPFHSPTTYIPPHLHRQFNPKECNLNLFNQQLSVPSSLPTSFSIPPYVSLLLFFPFPSFRHLYLKPFNLTPSSPSVHSPLRSYQAMLTSRVRCCLSPVSISRARSTRAQNRYQPE